MALDFNKKDREPVTLAQKMGFGDSDIKTSKHDAIMLWLDARVRDPEFFTQLLKWTPEWKSEKRSRTGEPISQFDHLRGPMPPKPRPSVKDVVWEFPVKSGPNFTAGFIDMVVDYSIPGLRRVDIAAQQDYDFVDGRYMCKDIVPAKYTWKISSDRIVRFGFEVKSHMASLGEVVRQIRFYQSKLGQHFHDDGDGIQMVVVAPPIGDAMRLILEQQNIRFIAAPDC